MVNSISQFLGVIGFLELGVGSVIQSSLYKPLADKDDESISKIVVSGQKFFSRLATILLVYVCILMVTYPFFAKQEGGFRYIYPNGKYSNNPSSDEIKEIPMPLGILEGFFWAKVYKREIFDGIRLPEGYWFEDSLNLHILFWKSKKSIVIPELVYGYYKNESGITHTSKKRLKSIDSLYITESLIKDHLEMGFDITQDYYEYFLRMVKLTYYRTREMDEKVRNSIFLCQCYLYENYFSSFSTGVREMVKLELSLKARNYKTYIYYLEL